jgi:predicted DNA-binding protein
MRGKLIRVPSETYDALKSMSNKHKTTMSDLLQRAVSSQLIQEIKDPMSLDAYEPPSDSELLSMMMALLESKR